MKVKLASADTARVIGIETVEARAAETADEVDDLGTVAYDATERAEVNARVRGVVRELLVEVGARVETGTPLVRIESAEVGAEQSRLLAAASRIEVARAAHERTKAMFDKGWRKRTCSKRSSRSTARAPTRPNRRLHSESSAPTP